MNTHSKTRSKSLPRDFVLNQQDAFPEFAGEAEDVEKSIPEGFGSHLFQSLARLTMGKCQGAVFDFIPPTAASVRLFACDTRHIYAFMLQ